MNLLNSMGLGLLLLFSISKNEELELISEDSSGINILYVPLSCEA